MGEHVLYSDQMERADRTAIERYRIPGLLLMEAAARGITREVLNESAGPVLILAGPGNNGGDGFAAARMLYGAGRKVRVLMARKTDEYGGDAGVNARIVRELGIPCLLFACEDGSLREEAVDELGQSPIVVDALLGTGVSGALRPAYRELVERVNAVDCSVVAVDVPTGVDPDTGQLADRAVQADITVTFAAAKPGLLLEPGCEMVGNLVVEDIGIPPRVIEEVVAGEGARCISLVGTGDVLPHLPDRTRTGHKGSYGHVVVLGGSPGFTGAAVMTAEAALRAGAGLVTCAVPEHSETAVASRLFEAMTASFSAEDPRVAMRDLEEPLSRADVVALGPGLGRGEGTVQLVREVVSWVDRVHGPLMVVDADGLNAVAGDPDIFSCGSLRGRVVLTPHPGEMARLMKCSTAEVLSDRCGIACEAAKASAGVVVLKGAPSITSVPSGETWVNSTGNPGLATGGSGDVLTGIIAAFLAQGVKPLPAAVSGTYLHGMAADLAAGDVDMRSMLPRDVIECVPEAIDGLEWK